MVYHIVKTLGWPDSNVFFSVLFKPIRIKFNADAGNSTLLSAGEYQRLHLIKKFYMFNARSTKFYDFSFVQQMKK